MKTKAITCVFNRPDLLGYQIRSLKKYIKGELEICVFYDTRTKQLYDEFAKVCDEHDVKMYYQVSEPGQSPSWYHAQAAKAAYEIVVETPGEDCIVLFLDHDMFLIDDFNPTEEMSNNDVMGCLQTRENVEYIWPGLFFCKKSSVEDIDFEWAANLIGKSEHFITGKSNDIPVNRKHRMFCLHQGL